MPKKTSKNITVKATDTKKRLDVFLSEQLAISRSQVQKLIEQNQILINKELPKKAGDQVKEGDVLVLQNEPIQTPKPKKQTVELPNTLEKEITSPPRSSSVKIIAETPEYIVVNKPTGLLTHPTLAEETEALSSYLLKKYPELKTVGEDPVRPGIVHRLDKEASGLLVIARTQPMFELLKEQFKNRTIEKEYMVLVHGRVAKDEDTISFPIARSESFDRMAAIPKLERGQPTSEGKEALTEFLVEQRFVNFTLLRVKIHTGRMHQIRAHFLAYNHPVVGDPLYFQKKRKNTWDKKLGRLFLHCTKLGFNDLEKNKQIFESPLPPELEKFLTTLV